MERLTIFELWRRKCAA